MANTTTEQESPPGATIDPEERVELLLRDLRGTRSGLSSPAALEPDTLLFVAPFPFIVWGADELRRWLLRRR